MDWETVFLKYLPVSKTFPNGHELVDKFKNRFKEDEWLRSWLDPPKGSFRSDNFTGTCHCEAIALALMHRREGLPQLQVLPVCYAV
jgi:hypothetical protein